MFVHPKKQNDQCDWGATEKTTMTKQHVVLSSAFEERWKKCSKYSLKYFFLTES
jgi:hypothetical protein